MNDWMVAVKSHSSTYDGHIPICVHQEAEVLPLAKRCPVFGPWCAPHYLAA